MGQLGALTPGCCRYAGCRDCGVISPLCAPTPNLQSGHRGLTSRGEMKQGTPSSWHCVWHIQQTAVFPISITLRPGPGKATGGSYLEVAVLGAPSQRFVGPGRRTKVSVPQPCRPLGGGGDSGPQRLREFIPLKTKASPTGSVPLPPSDLPAPSPPPPPAPPLFHEHCELVTQNPLLQGTRPVGLQPDF